jgi:hypothetical protein
MTILRIHMVIQSSCTVLKDFLGAFIWSRKCKSSFFFFFRFATVSKLQRFDIDVAFIIVVIDFYKMEAIRFNTTCQLSSLFAMEKRKRILLFVAFFNRQFRLLLFFITFLFVWRGVVRALTVLYMITNRCSKCHSSV